ncbi:ARL2BP-like protein [Schistosoma mansoni]|uniref:ARL2BP-like protein n=1 Tax=Schistosoma mansoni TaxID=6183 RepID=UPI00022DC456|nr:ARL2BP-like protein [Schistosoma mansoni]|eukprot:XP_018652937.1 ARL2BP-like protein [Schistosoma mansoni]
MIISLECLLLKPAPIAQECQDRSQEPSSDFDNVVGHLEEIIMSNHFQSIQDQFMNENYDEFDENEENEFCYTEIHEKYINTVERMLEEQLCQRIPHFSMRSFIDNLVSNSNCLDGEIFEMLYTFTDFLAFKEMMIDYKKVDKRLSVNGPPYDLPRHIRNSSIPNP